MADFDIEFCPFCGEEINYMANTCYECGEDLPKDASFCPHCEEEEEEVEEKRRNDLEQLKISKDQDEVLINEVTDFIKSHISFDCKLKVSLTLTYIEIQARIVDTGYSLSARILQKDIATALPKFVKALIATYEVVGK